MLIRTKLLLLALVPLPVLLVLVALNLSNAQTQYREAQQLARAMGLVKRGSALGGAIVARRDAEAAELSEQSRGLESLLENDSVKPGPAPVSAPEARSPGVAAAITDFRAVGLDDVPDSVREGVRSLDADLEQMARRQPLQAGSTDLGHLVNDFDRLIRALDVLPQLVVASSNSAHARQLQTLSLVLQVRDSLARERLYLRHAIVTNALSPALARDFVASQGLLEQQSELLQEVFADGAQREALLQAFARSQLAGRDRMLAQLRNFNARADQLVLLIGSYGYGGAAYYFRLFTISGDPKARSQFEAHASGATAVIEEMLGDTLLVPEERADLQTILRVVAAYRSRISEVASLRAQGVTLERIFPRVKVDDDAALAALKHLNTFRPVVDAASWDRLEARLLGDVEGLAASLAQDIEQQIQSERDARGRQRALLVAAALGTLLLLVTLTYVLYQRLAGGIEALVREFGRVAATGDVRPRTVVEGADELAQLNQAMSALGRRLEALADAADRMAAGDIESTFEPLGREDRMANAMVTLTHSARSVVAQAQAISAGNYATVVEPRSEKDSMAFALADMAQALRHLREENEQAQWLSGAQLQVLGAMGNADLPEALGGRALVALSSLTGSPLGLVYLQRDEMLVAVSAHGTADIEINTRQAPQEGLVGRAMKATRSETFTHLPAGYLRLRSGLGQGDVAAVSLTPLRARGQAVGVLELGWFVAPDARLMSLLDTMVESLGLALLASESRRHTELLLEETRRQAARLSEQQEELRQTNEELEEQAQLLRQSEEELKSQREELQTGNEELQEKSNLLLRQREQLEKTARDLAQATRYKSEFLANMSHELRTPLNSLLILSRSLMGNEEGNLNEDQIQSARIIHEGGRDLLNLINDILDLSKVEAGKLDIHLQPFSVTSMVDSLRRQFEPVAGDRKLKLVFDTAPDVSAEIVSDRQRVEQILRNLLSNALKFTEKGSVTLRIGPAAARHAAGEQDGPLLAFTVEDTGIGIPQEKLELIFQAFQQADGSTSRRYGGTGLGLTIARQLAALLGGAVRVTSTVGKGSRFTLILPERHDAPLAPSRIDAAEAAIAEATQSTPADTAPSTPAPNPDAPVIEDDRAVLTTGDRSMLVIDDDLRFAGVVRDIVRKRGYKCIVAGDGISALRLARRYLPSAILLDMRLPDMEGRRVLDELKWSPVTRHIPVHVVSAMDPTNEPLKQGAIGFLHKPAEFSDLQQVVDRLDATLARDRRTVLVVEDDRHSQVAIRSLLENGRTQVLEATTAAQAMQVLKDGPVDCIVLDLSLPDTDGFQFLEQLRKSGDEHPPVVVYTGRELSTEEHRRLSELAQSVVIKGAASPDRLLDDVLLFLHAVEADLPEKQKQVVARLHSGDDAFEGRKLLIVDDDLRNVFALSGLLKKRGLEVLVADNGEMALQKLNENPAIDAVLMDIMMPVMDGFEAMRHIRADGRWKKLPIIAVTAKAMAEDRRRCMDAGASDYLSKPIELDALLAMLRVWFGRNT